MWKNRFRVVAALTLVLAVASSLWFAAPVKALAITISDPSPTNLGSDISFNTKVSLEEFELLSIKSVNLDIRNLASSSTYYDNYIGLPLDTTEDYVILSTQGTGGNAQIKTTTETKTRGFGYAVLEVVASITHDVIWSSPEGWPAGDYEIKVTTKANGSTFTQTETVTLTEPVITDTTAPVISGVLARNITNTSADIRWTTNELSDSQVEYDSRRSPLNETLTLEHRVQLTDLALATTYHFKVMSKDGAGNPAVSAEYTFTTLGEPATFVVSTLSITPAGVDIGQEVTVSILVTNTGDLEGTYEVTLTVNDVVVAAKDITLAGGTSQEVAFIVTEDTAGVYTVNVNDLLGTFEVREAPVIPPPTSWGLISGIIAACIISGISIGVVVWRLIIRRRFRYEI